MNKIISGFLVDSDFSIYQLVRESVSYKCILPSQNELIMDTFYTIKEHLIANDFIIEKKEMTSYFLTGKGIRLKTLGSIEKFEESESKRTKRSILDILLFKNKQNPKTYPAAKLVADFYE